MGNACFTASPSPVGPALPESKGCARAFLSELGLEVYVQAFELSGYDEEDALQRLDAADLDVIERHSHVPILPTHRTKLLHAAQGGQPGSQGGQARRSAVALPAANDLLHDGHDITPPVGGPVGSGRSEAVPGGARGLQQPEQGAAPSGGGGGGQASGGRGERSSSGGAVTDGGATAAAATSGSCSGGGSGQGCCTGALSGATGAAGLQAVVGVRSDRPKARRTSSGSAGRATRRSSSDGGGSGCGGAIAGQPGQAPPGGGVGGSCAAAECVVLGRPAGSSNSGSAAEAGRDGGSRLVAAAGQEACGAGISQRAGGTGSPAAAEGLEVVRAGTAAGAAAAAAAVAAVPATAALPRAALEVGAPCDADALAAAAPCAAGLTTPDGVGPHEGGGAAGWDGGSAAAGGCDAVDAASSTVVVRSRSGGSSLVNGGGDAAERPAPEGSGASVVAGSLRAAALGPLPAAVQVLHEQTLAKVVKQQEQQQQWLDAGTAAGVGDATLQELGQQEQQQLERVEQQLGQLEQQQLGQLEQQQLEQQQRLGCLEQQQHRLAASGSPPAGSLASGEDSGRLALGAGLGEAGGQHWQQQVSAQLGPSWEGPAASAATAHGAAGGGGYAAVARVGFC